MIKEDDFVSMTKDSFEWFGYVVQFVEPNHKGIKVQWHPEFSSWHNYDELTLCEFPEHKKPMR